MSKYNNYSKTFVRWWSGDSPTFMERERRAFLDIFSSKTKRHLSSLVDHPKRKRSIQGSPGVAKRKRLFDKYSGVCQYCGCLTSWNTPGPSLATIDHILPLCRGGTHEWANLTLSCYDCNNRKGSRLAQEFMET